MEFRKREVSPDDATTDPDLSAPLIPGLSLRPGFRLRQGQALFLARLADAFERGEMNQLGVFVPGYGKTITALASFVVAHHLRVAQKLVVFVPRGNLRDQYADPEELARVLHALGAPPFSFCVADSERVFLKNLHTQIIITTYQYASGRGGHRALLEYCQSAPCMFVFDEVHHLSEDGHWATRLEQFPSACSVALSGTPMRSDNKTLFGVPFVLAEDGNQYYVALHEVTLRDAHTEGRILKRVDAHIHDYRVRMVHAETGEEVELSLSQLAEKGQTSKEVDAFLARRRLRFHEVYLEGLLGPAFERFAEKRRGQAQRAGGGRNHQMLIIAMSNRHAEAILSFVERRFPAFSATRIGQDIAAPQRALRLQQYRDGHVDVMVQVDMIGEGTDIKPISVVVKADLVRAMSKTMQQVFRGMRYFDGFGDEGNSCDVYAANDSEVVQTLEWIASEAQIGVKLRDRRERREAPAGGQPSERSAWEITQVEHRRAHTHSLLPQPAPAAAAPADAQAVDVSRLERDLRKECAALANELSFVLSGRGQDVGVREIHARAKQMLKGAQGDLSVHDLRQKRRWLERCLSARRLL